MNTDSVGRQIGLTVALAMAIMIPNSHAQDDLDESNLTWRPEYGIAFDGESTYIKIDDGTPFNLEEFSLEVWVRFNATHENQVFMNRGAAGRDFTFYLYDRIRFLVGSEEGYNHANAFVPPADTWLHIVGTYSFDGVKLLYYNGVLVGEQYDFSYQPETDDPLYIGALEPGMRHLDGEMENLRIWSKTLSEEEILTLLKTEPESENMEELKANGLIAYWAARSVEGNKVTDLTGNGHDGVFYEHAIDESHLTFKPSQGLVFDGETAYAIVENGVPFTVEQISVETWVYLDPGMSSRTLGYRGIIGRSVVDELFSLYVTSHYGNRIHMQVFDYGDCQATIPPPESWLHVCATYDLNHLRLYYNGVLMDEVEAPRDASWADWGDIPLFIGAYSDFESYFVDESSYFMGMIENIRIWNRALSGADIQELLGVSPEQENISKMKQDGLIAYYAARSLSGDTLQDLSGNGNDAVFTGIASVKAWGVH